MRIVVAAALAASLTAGVVAASPAYSAGFDGNWRVTIVTEKGACDRAYGYAVAVHGGNVTYTGSAAVSLSGTVSPDGVVRVSVNKGGQHAEGVGRLDTNTGGGHWRGAASSGGCSGSWQAERR